MSCFYFDLIISLFLINITSLKKGGEQVHGKCLLTVKESKG